jgi:hypothetical protein
MTKKFSRMLEKLKNMSDNKKQFSELYDSGLRFLTNYFTKKPE